MKNGSNGHDKNNEGRIIKFPSSAERERHKKQKDYSAKERAEAAAKLAIQAQGKTKSQPFLKLGNIPPFVRFLTAAFLTVHIGLYLFSGEDLRLLIFYRFGFIPGSYTGAYEWHWSALAAPLTHIFIHGNWMHLAFNVIMAFAFGTFFEKTYGVRRSALFFIICSLSAALTALVLTPFSTIPVIGASGGISGWFGALLLMMYDQQGRRHDKYGPWPIIIFWGLIMILPGLFPGGALAWQAHLGGYLGGIILFTLMQKGKIRL